MNVGTYGLAQVDLDQQKCEMKHDAEDYDDDAHDTVRPRGNESQVRKE
jgi:hypothetical protein